MTLPRQLFRRRIADALASLVAQKHRTAKQIARTYSIDPSTAENLRKGHLSVPTLEKTVATDGWDLWMALGEAVIGQPYHQHLETVIEREARVQEQRAWERDRVHQMEIRAAELGAVLSRPGA